VAPHVRPLGPDDGDEIVLLARRLIASWQDSGNRNITIKKGRSWTQPQFAIVHGLSAHAHRVAAPALDMLERGLVLESMPLVRTTFECALTAQWVAQIDDAAQAFINADIRKRRALVKDLEQAVSQAMRTGAPDIAARLVEELPSSSNAAANNFHDLCLDLQRAGYDAYATYRMMSHFSHASVIVADEYLREPDPGVAAFGLRMEPDQPPASTWSFMVAASLVWAGRAVDYFDSVNLRRSELREAAQLLNTTTDMKPSDRSWLRRNARG
jgi:hypothetical protein